jgi:hypothetical protein
MRRVTALCAAACVALSALAIAKPAEAAFHVVRWDNTGYCEIWDESFGWHPYHHAAWGPWLTDYRVVSKPQPTFSHALAVKDSLLKHRNCSF